MKIFFLLILTGISGLLLDCNKKPFNYRNHYTGNWTFTYIAYACCPDNTTNGTYSGKIYYDKTMGKNGIFIDFKSDRSDLFTIDKSGVLGGCGVNGKINGKSLSFVRNYYKECTGALGSAFSYTITGTKN